MSGRGGATSAAPALPLRPRRGRLHAVVATVRPRQWTKNLLVIAAAGAAGALGHDDVPLRVGLAFLAFCFLASGIYAVNDVRDAEEDRLHPRKRERPVAAGELAPAAALRLGAALMVAGLALCVAIRPLLGARRRGISGAHAQLRGAVAAHRDPRHRRDRGRLRAPRRRRRRRRPRHPVALVHPCHHLLRAARRGRQALRRTDAHRCGGPR